MSIDNRMFSTPAWSPALVRRVTIDTHGMEEQQQSQQQQTFPFKLYNMLEYACDSDSEFSSCISWSVDGSAFIIRDKDVMMANLAPTFFNWTHYRSFTRQLNIWGFSRTEIQTGQSDGWRHNKFVRGRPDLLNEIERMKNSFSTAKALARARQQQAETAAESMKNVAVAAGVSCSSSSLRLDSQANQPYNETDGHFGIVAEATSSHSQAQALQVQGSVFRYYFPNSASLIQPPAQPAQLPAQLPAQPPAQAQTFSNETATQAPSPRTEQAGAMDRNRTDVDTTTASTTTTTTTSSNPNSDLFVPVFDDDELMYLESIFGQDEHISHEEELSSILSLDRENTNTTVEDSKSRPK